MSCIVYFYPGWSYSTEVATYYYYYYKFHVWFERLISFCYKFHVCICWYKKNKMKVDQIWNKGSLLVWIFLALAFFGKSNLKYGIAFSFYGYIIRIVIRKLLLDASSSLIIASGREGP